MKLNFGKRSVKDVFIGDYDYRFLCMVRTAIHLLSQREVQRHCTLGPGRSIYCLKAKVQHRYTACPLATAEFGKELLYMHAC